MVASMRTTAAAAGFLLFQAVIGYEWLASGLTKVVHGDFPGGLAHDLLLRQKDSAHWYRHVLNSVVIPHAPTFGYLIEATEIAMGVVLIGSAGLKLGLRVSPSLLRAATAATAIAALAGLLLAVNLVFANSVDFGPIAPDSFEEGIGIDALLVGLQSILLESASLS